MKVILLVALVGLVSVCAWALVSTGPVRVMDARTGGPPRETPTCVELEPLGGLPECVR